MLPWRNITKPHVGQVDLLNDRSLYLAQHTGEKSIDRDRCISFVVASDPRNRGQQLIYGFCYDIEVSAAQLKKFGKIHFKISNG